MRMIAVRISITVALSLACATAAHANRIACTSSNGDRWLAKVWFDAPKDARLGAELRTIAEATGSKLITVEVVTPPSDQFTIISGTGAVEIELRQVRGSSEVSATAERACSSTSIDGWQELWQAALTQLQKRGYSLFIRSDL